MSVRCVEQYRKILKTPARMRLTSHVIQFTDSSEISPRTDFPMKCCVILIIIILPKGKTCRHNA